MNRAPKRQWLINAIQKEGVHEHAQHTIDYVILQLQCHQYDLMDRIARNKENGVIDLDSETIKRMRDAELARARQAYGIR